MAAESNPKTSGFKEKDIKLNQDYEHRHPTIAELLIQIESKVYKTIEHRASLLISVWTCLSGKVRTFHNIEKVFHMLYRESAMMIFSSGWTNIGFHYKRGLARSLTQFSQAMGSRVSQSDGLCSALVMTIYDPWGDPVILHLLSTENLDREKVSAFISSEPFELLLIRVECLVTAHLDEAAIRLCRCCLEKIQYVPIQSEPVKSDSSDNWRWTFTEWLLLLLFRRGQLNELVAESAVCSCHDGVRLIYQTNQSQKEHSEALTETLINLFLVRDLLFQSNYCCTNELMTLWCEFQIRKKSSVSEVHEAARKLLVGHASTSAHFYLFVDILWGKFSVSLLPLYLEFYIRGLTSDLNYLEIARQAENRESVIEIENHMAAMYFKLSSMFISVSKEIALECMLSSFSLDPTQERLDWIKNLFLQISKEKAMKAAAACNEKNKPCGKSGILSYPASVKRKAVVMCDQAIQTGDDLIVDGEPNSLTTNGELMVNVVEKINDAICEESLTSSEVTSAASCFPEDSNKNAKDTEVIDLSIKGLEKKHGCDSVPIVNGKENMPDVEVDNVVKEASKSMSGNKDDDHHDELQNGDLNESETESFKRSFDPNSNNLNTEPNLSCNSTAEEQLNKNLKTDENDPVCDSHVSDKITVLPLVDKKIKKDETVIENSDNVVLEEPVPLILIEEVKNDCQKHSEKSHVSDCNEVDKSNEGIDSRHLHPVNSITDDKNEKDSVSKLFSDGDKHCTDTKLDNTDYENVIKEKLIENSETPSLTTQSEEQTSKQNLGEVTITVDAKKVDERSSGPLNLDDPGKADASNIQRKSCRIQSVFSHVILDCNIPGVSCEVLSDLVIVLESLRNKQLKTSNKWSQMKHLCEEYLEIVSDMRYTLLNMQLNESVDSEADSMSETAFGNNPFASHQSDESMAEDHNIDKGQILNRFLESNNPDANPYVNLSDIHIPQIPLERLFYEHSSSHLGHKKKHRKHRNHDKNPEKAALRKLRRESRVDKDLIKRKKRKRRKDKRGKNHGKKHHFSHGKISKNYSKSKKKKHSKKKKDGNSGFISGDYCSDFSSEELMRLVKEHSSSYAILPAASSKHPHTSTAVVPYASPATSDVSDEPARKKRRQVSFRGKAKEVKSYEKHKHEKSKPSRRSKKIHIEECSAELKNVTSHNNSIQQQDYSRIVQISSVKKMEAVEIRQSSVALNLSNISKIKEAAEVQNESRLSTESMSHSLLPPNFSNYSAEDLMKMQLLMSGHAPEVEVSSSSKSTFDKEIISPDGNQSVLKYVCSKMTSHLLSMGKGSKCMVKSESKVNTSPIVLPGPSSQMQGESSIFSLPQNLPQNLKHVVIERNTVPYNLMNRHPVQCNTIIPVRNMSSPVVSESSCRSLMTTVISNNMSYPTTSSPQVTAFTIPISHSIHDASGSKLVTGKIVIPLNQCSNVRAAAMSTPIPLTDSSMTSNVNQSIPGMIVLKNGNNTQVISTQPQRKAVSNFRNMPRCQAPGLANRASVFKSAAQLAKNIPTKNQASVKNLAVSKSSGRSLVSVVPTDFSSIKSVCPTFKDVSKPPEVMKESHGHSNKPDIASSAESLEVTPSVNKTEIVAAAISAESSVDTSSSKAEISKTDTSRKTDSTTIKDVKALQSSLVDDLCPISVATNVENKSVSDNLSKEIQESKNSDRKEHKSSKVATATDKNLKSVTDKSLKSAVDKSLKSATDKSLKSTADKSLKSAADRSLKTTTDKSSRSAADRSLKSAADKNLKSDVDDEILKATIEKILKSSSKYENKIDKPTPMSEKKSSLVADTKSKTAQGKSAATDLCVGSPASSSSSSIAISTNSPASTVTSSIDQPKPLQPIIIGGMSSGVRAAGKVGTSGKAEGISLISEVPTRSFTSISDAVRFSLMDMDDATGSVENQVLQAFQASHESSRDSPNFDSPSTSSVCETSTTTLSTTVLTTPKASSREINVSTIAGSFESSVHTSQKDKFAECQSTLSRTTTWIMDDSPEACASRLLQKSSDIDSASESKDDDRPKKKRKKKERSDRDPECAHKYWCEICHRGFFSAYNLRRHCRNVHKMDLPKGTTDLPFGNSSSQCLSVVPSAHSPDAASRTTVTFPNVQQPGISPKASEFVLQSPTREAKTQEFSLTSPPSQHSTPIKNTPPDFSLQSPTRIPVQSTSAHVSPITSAKDFRLQTPTSITPVQVPQSKPQVTAKSNPKFQRLPTSCVSSPQVLPIPKLGQMHQVALCGQPPVQQARQLNPIQSSAALIPSLPSVACQAQQIQQNAQCPHFQATKPAVQPRIGQIQLMQHVGQLPQIPHAPHTHTAPKTNNPTQTFKKCATSTHSSKISETEQMQQAQIVQNQQILANQQMQKLVQLRQSAIASAGIGCQTAVSEAQAAALKSQFFQSQLAASRQAAANSQLQPGQRSQGPAYGLQLHTAAGHQFFSPAVQPTQEQPNCPHSMFTPQSLAEFSSSTQNYPTIRLSSETNDGLEDLEQFLLENMPWSSEQAAAHHLTHQVNRPSSTDSLTLTGPPQTSGMGLHRTAAAIKNKTPISRPKPRKPTLPQCSKNLLGSLGRGVKKKTCLKKTAKHTETGCVSKLDGFNQPSVVPQQSSLNMNSTCNVQILNSAEDKQTGCKLVEGKHPSKSPSSCSVNENDSYSSDSIQCIKITHKTHPKESSTSVGIDFNTFSQEPNNSNKYLSHCGTEKSINTSCNTNNPAIAQTMVSFLDQCSLTNKSGPGLEARKISIGCSKSQNITSPVSVAHVGFPKADLVKTSINSAPCSSNKSPAVFLGMVNGESNCSLRTGNILYNETETESLGTPKIKLMQNECSFMPTKATIDIDSEAQTQDLFLCGSNGNASPNNDDNIEAKEVAQSSTSLVSGEALPSDIEVSVDNCSEQHSKHKSFPVNNFSEPSKISLLKDNSVTDAPNESIQKADDSSNKTNFSMKANKDDIIPIRNCSDDCTKDVNNSTSSADFKIKSQLKDIPQHNGLESVKSPSNGLIVNLHKVGQDHPKTLSQCNVHTYKSTSDKLNMDNKESKDDLAEITSQISSNCDKSEIEIKPNVKNKVTNKMSSNCFEETRSNSTVEKIDEAFRKCEFENSSHVNIVPNDENKFPNEGSADCHEEDKNSSVRIALRIRKTVDGNKRKSIDKDKNFKYCVSPTSVENVNLPIKKANQKKKKSKPRNEVDLEPIITKDNVISNKLTSLPEVNYSCENQQVKENLNSPCFVENQKVDEVDSDTHKNGSQDMCLDEEKVSPVTNNELLKGRSRLRDMPKTSVKRMCPCCMDSHIPKKCNVNGKANKNKQITLKARNANGLNLKANTRSSQRLRSRNNAPS